MELTPRLSTSMSMTSLLPSLFLGLSLFNPVWSAAVPKDASVLILGGGVTGVIAARTLHERGHDNFIIVEARHELGGRLQSVAFGESGRQSTVELGANWVQGTQTGNGPENPIFTLTKEHGVKTVFNDLTGSIETFDTTGRVDFLDAFNDAEDDFSDVTVLAGERVSGNLIDLSTRTGYSLAGSKPKTSQQQASEYYVFDWEYAQTPEESSMIASSLNNNFTFNDFSDDNLLSIDQRGFKTFIQAEASTFLKPSQVMFNTTVRTISYSSSGVTVTLTNGKKLSASYALCTFSVGVLQNDDVAFQPALPGWKEEAIQSTVMATYTKIFFQFSEKFWFDTQMALYADPERGRYTVWQSLDVEGFLPGSGIVFVTITGDHSIRASALPASQIEAESLSVLAAMFPNVTIPKPTAFMFPNWNLDPLFRGSYSNWPAGFDVRHQRNLRATVNERLWFAGEATSFKYYGFLHGAYFEGLNVTNAMIDCIEAGGSCAGLAHVENVISVQ